MSSNAEQFTRLLRMVQSTIQSADAERELTADPRSWLLARGITGADLEATVQIGAKRLLLYRKLVRRGLARAIRIEIPRTAARLSSAFDVYTSRYCEEALPESHYLRDVAFEFVSWVCPKWAMDPSVPRFLIDLARHELCAFDVTTAERSPVPPATDCRIELDVALRFDVTTRIADYAFAVHRLSEDENARDTPEQVATSLLAYRDRDEDPRFLELTPLARAIVGRLVQGLTLRRAVLDACGELGHPCDAAVLDGTSALLADLGARGVIIGVGRD